MTFSVFLSGLLVWFGWLVGLVIITCLVVFVRWCYCCLVGKSYFGDEK